jgi:type I restriction enzyme S subunit
MKGLNAGLRMTEIGVIPENWEVIRLGNEKVCQIAMGQSPPSSTYNKTGEGLPFLQGNAEFGEIFPSPSIYCSNPVKIAEKNDVLISVRAPVGEVNISPSRVCIGRGLAAIRCKPDKTNDLFLFYYLKHMGNKLESISAGSTFKAIRKNDLDQLEILLPPLAEQRRIAGILTTVDQAIEKVDEAIEKTQKLKKGLMQALLTKGIQKGRFKIQDFKDTEIGRIPKEWEIRKLGDVITLCQYGLSMQMNQEGQYPIVKMDDVVNGYVVPDRVKYIDLNKRTFQNFKLEKGDILFNRTNSYELVGRTGIFLLDGDYVFASYLIRLRPNYEIVNPFYLTTYLIFSGEKLRQLATRAVHQANINATTLRKVIIPIPPLKEQQKIAEILSTVDERLESLRNRREKLKRIKKGLMEDLLTGKVRVTNLIS